MSHDLWGDDLAGLDWTRVGPDGAGRGKLELVRLGGWRSPGLSEPKGFHGMHQHHPLGLKVERE